MSKKFRNSEIKTLKDLSLENRLLIVDASAIMAPLGTNRENLRLKEKINLTEGNKRFLGDMIKYIENGSNFYITQPVLEEIYEGCKYKKTSDPYGLIEEEEKERERLADSFKDNKKIIVLDRNKEDMYVCISEKYKWIGKKRGLSCADFDLLIKGLTLSITSKPVKILSNDYHVFYARNDILQRINSHEKKIYNRELGDKDIGFFNRIGFFDFKSLVM